MSDDKIAEIKARHKAGPLGQMPREDRMSNFLRWQWLLGEVDRRGAEIEKQRAEIERLRAALRDIDALNPDVPDALGANDLRVIVAQMGDLARAALEAKQ